MSVTPLLRELLLRLATRPALYDLEGPDARLMSIACRCRSIRGSVGVGERTLNRLLVEETGLSFGRWRQQLHIILAIQKLSRGATVQSVALDLGYESASSFVTMFRKPRDVARAVHGERSNPSP